MFLWADTWTELSKGIQITRELVQPQLGPTATSVLELSTLPGLPSAACKFKFSGEHVLLGYPCICPSSTCLY